MTSREVYQWSEEIGKQLGMLTYWQRIGLALFSLGVVLAERCTLSKVAERLGWAGKADSIERRMQRLIANRGIEIGAVQVAWARWVLSACEAGRQWWLVDETKLSNHLGIMVVSIAYRQHAIPLAWRCYAPGAYPAEGQVKLILGLVERLLPLVAQRMEVLVMADRGLGTSAELVRGMQGLGVGFLLWVQGQSVYRSTQGAKGVALNHLAQRGEAWHGQGTVFKEAGGCRVAVHVIWGGQFKEPWCLISSHADLTGWEYSIRYWQEGSFRDWKSDGWHWQRSQVWLPDHADRLLLILAVAMAWTLTHGVLAAADPLERAALTRGNRHTFSLFRLGIRALARCRFLARLPFCGLYFRSTFPPFQPPPPIHSLSVVS